MDIGRFEIEAPGRIVRIPEGTYAFIPDPLPPDLKLDSRLMNILSDATLALGELKGIGANLPNPYLLIGPLSTREAMVSCRLEGTVASAEELAIFDANPGKKAVRDEVGEVRNYVTAMEYGLRRLQELPVSKRLFREMHVHLLSGVRGQEHPPGEFRNHQVHIGQRGMPVEHARFVPPPVVEMNQALDELENYLHSPSDLPSLIRAALLHYQFETIHPFMDGNGRLGRLMITLLLCDWKVLPEPFLYMSSYFEREKDRYQDGMLSVSQKGAWHDWVCFFLRGVVEQSQDAIARSDKLLTLQREYREAIQSSKRASALLLKLVDGLFAVPWVTMAQTAKKIGVTPAAAQNNIMKLVDLGILREVTGKSWGRIYVAPGIIEIIEKDVVS